MNTQSCGKPSLAKKIAIRIIASLFVAAAYPSMVIAESFIDIGIHTSNIESKLGNQDAKIDQSDSGVHFGIGARRQMGEKTDLGLRLDIRNINSNILLAVRALDYRRHVNQKLSINAFLGAARLDLATPAYGYYIGGGIQLQDIVSDWDLGIDLFYGDKVARDNLLPTDPQGGSTDNFHDVSGISVYLSYDF